METLRAIARHIRVSRLVRKEFGKKSPDKHIAQLQRDFVVIKAVSALYQQHHKR